MNIVTKKISELIPYDNNPRKNDGAVKYVANSIKEFGFKVPIVIDKNDEIIAGHTRYLACMELGIDEVPCVIADDLTEEQVKAFRLADNKVGEMAGWDYSMLEEELSQLAFNMEKFGFVEIDDIDIDGLFEESEAPPKSDTKTMVCPYCGEQFEI